MNPDVTRRATIAGAAGLLFPAQPAAAAPAAPIILNDASQLNPTPVVKSASVGRGQAAIARLRRELRAAATEGRPVAMGGARHSMGGQSLPRLGFALTIDQAAPEVDTRAGLYRVGAGARWRDVIATLGPLGHSPKVMQANNDFSIGGTFSVNAHGWPAPLPPMGGTVRAIRLMLADGAVVEASPTREPELFALAMGGYGLVGVILDLDIEMVPNRALTVQFSRMAAPDVANGFVSALTGPGRAELVYGRLSVARDDFLHEASMVAYRPTSEPPPAAVGRAPGWLDGATRGVYRAQVGSDAMKRSRWFAETVLAPRLHPRLVSRNTLLDTSVSLLASSDQRRTDILHEYFLPPARLEAFLTICRKAIPASGLELLNVTLRYVAQDKTSMLRFAPADRIAAVMSFSQRKNRDAESAMAALTPILIDAALAQGGSYYLPYRLHARPDQLLNAYPQAAAFAAAKRRLDPQLLFRHALWDRYFAAL